jgi:hypothetical protein
MTECPKAHYIRGTVAGKEERKNTDVRGTLRPAFAAKAARRSIPLWFLFVAVQLVDIAWAILVLAGIEKVRIAPGITAANPLDLYCMPYTHSLIGLLEFAILFGGLVLYLKKPEPVSRGGGYGVIAFVVVIAVLQAGSLFGPPPPSDKVPAIKGLALYFALTAIAHWLEKKRQPRL